MTSPDVTPWTTRRKANVLIVDDNPDTVALSTEIVESAGHSVLSRANGAEGLESLTRGRLPDCIVLDVEMPVLGGPGMAHAMRLHDAGEEKVPILLVSSRHDLAEIAGRMGTPYFLSKMATDYKSKLVKLISRVLIERRAPVSA